MIHESDYKEPRCPLSDPNEVKERIPVRRIIERLDKHFAANDLDGAGELLRHWLGEAVSLGDLFGELSILNELTGHYRKTLDRDRALTVIDRALILVDELGQGSTPSGATILLNCATTLKTFGQAERALLLYERAESVYRSSLDVNDARFAALYNNRALSLSDLGRFDEAEASYNAALAVLKNVGLDAAVTYVNLAELYDAWGKTERISECLFRALDLLFDEKIPHDGYYAFVLEKCAPAFRDFGYTEVADELKRTSEEIYARA